MTCASVNHAGRPCIRTDEHAGYPDYHRAETVRDSGTMHVTDVILWLDPKPTQPIYVPATYDPKD